jgi:3-methyladenine DNA glycosylase Tag
MHSSHHHRCPWAQGDDVLMARYHDNEWGVPQHVVRSRAKIEAAIDAARIYCHMHEDGEDFGTFCWSFSAGKVLVGAGGQVPARHVFYPPDVISRMVGLVQAAANA